MRSSQKKDGQLRQFAAGAFILALVCAIGLMFFTRKQPPAPKPPVRPVVVKPVVKPPPAKVTGYITLILDDWGYNRAHCKQLAALDAPVVAAVLPGLEYSTDIIQCANASGHEAILHLPIEPHVLHEAYPRGYFLTVAMSSDEVKRSLKRTLDNMKGVVGVNNHEGSKGTENLALMMTVLGELKHRGLFFVDSVTSDKSICSEAASRVNIPFTHRDIFIDNRMDRASIERQIQLAASIAREKGFALVIGHDRALTLQIVGEQIHKLRQQGYVFLSLRDYIKARNE